MTVNHLYEVAEDVYLARTGSASTNGIAAVVDTITPLVRRQVAEEIAQAIEGEARNRQSPRLQAHVAAEIARRIGGVR